MCSITIVTPYRNGFLFARDFVSSMQLQVYQDWKCILVDDNSTDEGPLLLSSLVSSDSRFLLVKNQLKKTSSGPASARNYGLSLVKSPFVAFCDIDDIWHPHKLLNQLDFHCRNNLDISVCAYGRFSDESYLVRPKAIVRPPCRLSFTGLHRRNVIPMLTVIISRELTEQDFDQIPHEDFLYWLKHFRRRRDLRYGCLPQLLAFYRVHNASISRNKFLMPSWTYRVYRALGYDLITAFFLTLVWMCAHFFQFILAARPNNGSNLLLKDLLGMPPLPVQ